MNVTAYEKEADIKHHFYFINFSDMKSAKYKFAGEHIHHSIELVFCYDGKIKADINKETINLERGDLLIINPLDLHYYEYVDNASCYILVISEDYINDVVADPNLEFVNKISLTEEETNNLLNEISLIYDKFSSMSFFMKKSFVLKLFSALEHKTLFRNKEFSNNRNICKNIISYIEENYMNKMTIDTIANHFGYSRNYFSHLFNCLMGENFNTFINRFRIKKVAELRKNNPQMLVEEAITKCGFCSRETYYRFLRKH